ncbi:MAG: NADP-dependent phosphogluconate dehydrogenase [Acidobacteriota bacterium]|nr:NADP-dependent phosphogluconate dehydrogenase [Blastocatellia bacterium]MDW8238214.1 NADP-dependent phosphogluconate dehydrogenase [Acidobacteriota bacterium]
MSQRRHDIGLIGLGTMGRHLALNIADHGYSVVGYEKDWRHVEVLREVAEGRNIQGAENLEELVDRLRTPRAVMILVQAGPLVDAVIQKVIPHLEPGDLIIDGSPSHFKDTNRRAVMLAEKGIHFLGVGIAGGEHGARYGPSLMPGGSAKGYERVQPIFEAIATKVDTEPCVAYLGPGSAGHYVKMVHDGIESAFMQLIAETYDLMKRGLGLTNSQLRAVYEQWNREELNSYLIEITAHIFRREDEKTGRWLIDVILDAARQNGTEQWASQEAMNLRVPVPTMDAAVVMRDLSIYKNERIAASQILSGPSLAFRGERERFIHHLRQALHVGMILTYAQGMSLLRVASHAYGYELNLEDVARIWRGGCTIRTALLEGIRGAYIVQPNLLNPLTDAVLAQRLVTREQDLRVVVRMAVDLGIPVPGLMSALAYYDGYRSAWLPANLIQAQRDYFGTHTYERVDAQGMFHTEWALD